MPWQILSIFSILIYQLAWAQKSPELDRVKTQRSIEECQRLSTWGLIRGTGYLKTQCLASGMHYASEAPLKPGSGPVRIGNYNLLHPGTDKTLFKDFGLNAQLIDNEFDVMAGIELVDVVATPRANNGKIAGQVEEKFLARAAVEERLRSLRERLQRLEGDLSAQALTEEIEGLETRALAFEKDLAAVALELEALERELSQMNQEIEVHSKAGFSMGNWEPGRRLRLRRLEEARSRKRLLAGPRVEVQERQTLLRTELEALQKEIHRRKLALVSSKQILKIAQLKSLIDASTQELSDVEAAFRKISRYYRIPGYLRLLEELRKLDSTWSLIVSPHGDAAVETNTQELVGFYYRASRLKPVPNQHCSENFGRPAATCYPNLYEDFMGENLAVHFSRRPFLGTFSDGQKSFSLLASHVVFESSPDSETQRQMLRAAFRVESLSELPTGINKQNYARFVEVTLSLRLVERLRGQGLEHIIYTGDLNLEAKNPFWKFVLEKTPDFEVLILEETSLSENRFVKGQESRGVSSNYDHFILSKEDRTFCRNERAVNFLSENFVSRINAKYFIRGAEERAPYPRHEGAEALVKARSKEMESQLLESNFSVLRDGSLVIDEKAMEKDMTSYRERVFESQLLDETFYKVYVQVMSDHLPIKIECEFN